MKEQKHNSRGNQLIGILLIFFGAIFLANQYLDIDLFSFAWPLFIVVPGLLAFFGSLAMPQDSGKGFNALGSILIMLGLLLFYQVTFDHFESWAYAWALVAPTSLGLGWIVYGLIRRDGEITREGMRIAGVGLTMFLLGAIFFELIIGIGGFQLPWARNLWPVLLILLGLLLLARSLISRPQASS